MQKSETNPISAKKIIKVQLLAPVLAAWDRAMELYSVFLDATFHAAFLWLGWNFGVIKFIPLNPVGPLDALILLFCFQFLRLSLLRNVETKYYPQLLPVDKDIFIDEYARLYHEKLEKENNIE